MKNITFSLKKLMLNIIGGFFTFIGFVMLFTDTLSGFFILIFGLLLLPITWQYIEIKTGFKAGLKHKLVIGSVVFVTALALLPPSDTNHSNLIKEETSSNIETSTGNTDIQNTIDSNASDQIDSPTQGEVDKDNKSQNSDTENTAQNINSSNSPSEFYAVNEAVSNNQHKVYKVMTVVDGDTLKLSIDGVTETIRIIGIDTPETVHPSKPVECFGKEASDKAKSLLSGKEVGFTPDPTQDTRDKYGRLLGYISLPDGSDFGELMIRGGYAHEYTYSKAYAKQTLYKSAQTYASTNKIGLWNPTACAAPAQPTPVTTTPTPTQTQTDTNGQCLIKGNISSSSGEKIYHVQGQQYYSQTVIDESAGERWFCTESDAVAAGWRRSQR